MDCHNLGHPNTQFYTLYFSTHFCLTYSSFDLKSGKIGILSFLINVEFGFLFFILVKKRVGGKLLSKRIGLSLESSN